MKIFIGSINSISNRTQKKYELRTDVTEVPLVCLSNFFWRYLDLFSIEKGIEIFNYELDDEEDLTKVFCLLLNNKLGDHIFQIGTKEECTHCIKHACIQTRTKIIKEIENNVVEDNRIKNIDDEIERLANDITDYDVTTNKISSIENLKKERDLFRYSQFISFLVENRKICCKYIIPSLYNSRNEHISDDVRRQIDTFTVIDEKEYYPIDLAVETKNIDLLKAILDMGEIKYSMVTVDKIINVILDNCRSHEDFSLVYRVFELFPSYSMDIFKISVSCDILGHKSFSMKHDDILIKMYKVSLRINSIPSLKTLLSRYKNSLIDYLATRCPDIYSPNQLKKDDYQPISDEMRMFIKEEIETEVNKYVLKSSSNNRVWGTDVVTGNPIYESDLYI